MMSCTLCRYTENCGNMETCDRLNEFRPDQIYLGDSLKLMQKIPAGSVDLVIADPPFGINFKAKRGNYNRNGEIVMDGYGEVRPEDYPYFTQRWIKLASSALKSSGSMFVVSGWNHLETVLAELRCQGLELVNHIIWKYQFGVRTTKKFVTSHYHILYVVKDLKRRHWDKRERYPEDVWYIKRKYHRGERKTPTRLPVALVQKMISFASYTGDLVLDPFVGSGTVPAVAKRMGRQFLGFELVPEYHEFAVERVQAANLDTGFLDEWTDEDRERFEKEMS